ncbi:MAG: Fic family protein [Bacillota bacterium]|nr:Fic family protein [Bacillota bacterium]
MANPNIAIRYTDEIYASKSELPVLMNTSLIDFAWAKIATYRQENSRKLGLFTMAKFNFTLTQTPAIMGRIGDFSDKLTHFAEQLNPVLESAELSAKLLSSIRFDLLKAIAEIERVNISDLSIKAMLNGTYMEENRHHLPILGYRDALTRLAEHPSSPLSENLLADIYGTIRGEVELTAFYRYSNPNNVYSAIQVNRDYQYAPYNEIPRDMEELFSFILNDSGDAFVKAASSLFYLTYIKPFDSHNEAVACLLAKYILAQSGLGAAASLIPFEKLVDPNNSKWNKICLETQRQADMTYILLYFIGALTPLLEGYATELRLAMAKSVDEERKSLDESDAPKKEEKPAPAEPVEVPAPVSEARLEEVEVAPVKAEPTPEVKPEKEPEIAIARAPAKLALSLPEPKMSDKEVKEYARYIVETNPMVRKPQAHFYATHCTMGRYYTISDYKRTIRCAYETARTSMDNLAAQGFYKKLKFKNKFVYTPIKMGDKQ